ncbi:MAG TPA: amino acid ABC transporter permease [Anaerolineales bacterium]|nr:amino acid ABC transporter permease [Anaerolineales bacterium]
MLDSLSLFLQRTTPELIQGTRITLQLTMIALGLGVLFGLPAALVRVYGGKYARRLVIGYIELFRGTPLLVQLFLIYYGLPDLGLTLSRLFAASITLGLNSGAYQAEYFRGAIQAVGSGQMLAARAVGMSRLQAIRYIILPQALLLALPAWSNEAVSMIKYTAVVFLIAVPDLMGQAKILAGRYFNPIEVYLTVALIYILLVFVATQILGAIERKMRTPGLVLEIERH